jgi:SH3 domain protein
MKKSGSIQNRHGFSRLTAGLLALALCLSSVSLHAQRGGDNKQRWVSDEFEITMRSGKGIGKSILRVLPSGTKLELLDDDPSSEYSRVKTSSGKVGWVLDRYLLARPPAKLRLPDVEARLKRSEEQRRQLERDLGSVRSEKSGLQSQVGKLENSGSGLQQELNDIRRLSADVVAVNDQNKELKKSLADGQRLIDELTSENSRLAARSNREWFVIGALVVIFGILIGLILPRIRWRKKSGWGDL